MPYFLNDETPDYTAVSQAASAAPDQTFAASYNAGLDHSALQNVGALEASSVADLLDTTASSVGLTNRQTINNTFLNTVGSPGLTKWFDENRGAVEVGSGIAGTVISIWAAGKILKPGGFAMRAIRNVPYAGKIATLDAQYERAMRLAVLTQRESAIRGAVGVERFSAAPMNLAALGRPARQTSPLRAAFGVRGTTVAKGLAQNALIEGIMAATLNQNSFLYSDDIGHNLAWSAAGFAIGAGIDSMISTYALRKLANSDKIRRLNAGAYDVSGVESQRIHAVSIVDDLLKDGKSSANREYFFGSGGATTDKITSLAIDARELSVPRGTSERALALNSKREAIATPKLDDAFEELNKVTVRGLSGVSKAGFGTKLEGLGAPLKESIYREPASMYGIEELGTTVENMTRAETVALRQENLARRFDQVQELLGNNGRWTRTKRKDGTFVDNLIPLNEAERSALIHEARMLHFKTSQIPVTMLEPGEWAPIQHGAIADNYQPRAVVPEGGLGEGNRKIWTRKQLTKDEPRIGLDDSGELYLPEGKRLEALPIQDMLGLYNVANRAVREMAAAGHVMQLPKNPNWFQLDMAEQLLKATGNDSAVIFPGAMTRQSAMVESFAQKVTALRKREQAMKMANKGGLGGGLTEAQTFENKVMFNLPRLTSYQQGIMGTADTPVDAILLGLKTGKEVRQMSHDELLKLLNDSKKITQFTDETPSQFDSLSGNSFNFLMDRDGNAIKPIIGFKRPLAPMDWTRDELFTRQAMKQASLKEHLTGEGADPLTKTLVESLMSNPNTAEARRVMELADDQQRSFVPGFQNSAPQTTRGSLINAVTTRERRDVDNLIMRAASIVKEEVTRLTSSMMRDLITGVMEDRITLVNSPRNADTKLLLNQFHSFRQGWDIARDPVKVQLPGGKTGYQFVLDHESEKNIKRFSRLFDRELQKGQVLLNPNGTELVLDELGLDVQKRLQKLHEAEVAAKNTLLRSQGLKEIKVTPWYAPPPNTKGKYLGFTFDLQDNVVPDMTIVASSPEELTRLKSDLQSSAAWKPGYSFRQKDQIESFMTLWDKAQMDFIAPDTTAIQPGKVNFGKTSGSLLNTNAFDESLVSIRDNLVRHGTDVLEVLFDDPIKAAKARAGISRVQSGVGQRATQHSSIYDRYVQNLLGRNALGAKDSFFGQAYSWATDRINGLLNSGNKLGIADTYDAVKQFIRNSSPAQPVGGKQFDSLSQSLGQYMPYKSAMEMAERESGSKTPKDIAAITSKLSWFEAASRLRWFESMHAVANIGSLIANTPSIIKALQPYVGETLEEAAKRNSSLVMMHATPDGGAIGLPNIPKLLWASMKDAWQKAPDEFTRKAIRLGYMDQEVAEFQRAWGSIDSKEGWRGFVFGNEAAEGKGFGARVAKSGGIDKWLSILSDKSEAFSRQWGMYAGKRVAEAIGIRNVDDQLAFAHDITNKIIANYDPRNRPEIFQGALGAPLGLFWSYVSNFYQRMFRYIETKNGQALANQFAMQSAVFGVKSVPGWDAFNWAFFDQGQVNGDDPVDSIYKRFGRGDGDLIMHGVLSSLPKLFGQDGINLYTRGDAQFRMPVVNIPTLDTFKRIINGVVEGVKQVKDANGLSWNHAAEILSNMVTNRPLAGMLEVFGAHGYDTSMDGQVVSQARSLAEKTYRVLGIRSMSQQKEIEAFYANKNAGEEQNALKTTLRGATRAAIRDGNFDAVPGLYKKYVAAGGKPEYYSRWVKDSFEAALDSRGERQLKDALKKEDGSRDAMIARLLDSQIDINDDDINTDDYGRQEEIEQVINQQWETTPEVTPSADETQF